jgi:membrane protein
MYDTAEERSIWQRYRVSIGLALAIGGCLVGSVLVLTLARHPGGSLHVAVDVIRWIVTVALLGIAVELLVRFAPAERRAKKWVTLGSAFTVVAWLAATLIFRVYVESVANFRSTFGTFVAALILTAYLYTTAIIFLVGVQADELIRKDATRGEQGLLGRVGAALG